MFQHATNEPETALPASAIPLAGLHLRTDTTQTHLRIRRWLCTAYQEVDEQLKRCKCIKRNTEMRLNSYVSWM